MKHWMEWLDERVNPAAPGLTLDGQRTRTHQRCILCRTSVDFFNVCERCQKLLRIAGGTGTALFWLGLLSSAVLQLAGPPRAAGVACLVALIGWFVRSRIP